MVHISKQEYIMEKPNGYIDTAATADTAKPPNNASESDEWKGVNQKYKTRRANPIKLAIP